MGRVCRVKIVPEVCIEEVRPPQGCSASEVASLSHLEKDDNRVDVDDVGSHWSINDV